MKDCYDFQQLLTHLVPLEDCTEETELSEDEQIERLNKLLYNEYDIFNDVFSENGAEIIAYMREFLKCIMKSMKGHDYAYSVFRGLLSVKHDWTFYKYFMSLIKYMWI